MAGSPQLQCRRGSRHMRPGLLMHIIRTVASGENRHILGHRAGAMRLRIAVAGSIAALSTMGCQPCLEFGCGEGGFVWHGESRGRLTTGEYLLQATTPSASYQFACTITESTTSGNGPVDCGSPQISGSPQRGGETETASFSFEETETENTIFVLRIHWENDEPNQEGDLGPEHVALELRLDDIMVFEEDYEPQYVVQSRGNGCGSCIHEAEEYAVVSTR